MTLYASSHDAHVDLAKMLGISVDEFIKILGSDEPKPDSPTFEEINNAPKEHELMCVTCQKHYLGSVYELMSDIHCCSDCFEAAPLGNLSAGEEERFPIPALLGCAQRESEIRRLLLQQARDRRAG